MQKIGNFVMHLGYFILHSSNQSKSNFVNNLKSGKFFLSPEKFDFQHLNLR